MFPNCIRKRWRNVPAWSENWVWTVKWRANQDNVFSSLAKTSIFREKKDWPSIHLIGLSFLIGRLRWWLLANVIVVVAPLICWEIKVSQCIIELSLLSYLAELNETQHRALPRWTLVKNWNSLYWMKQSSDESQPPLTTSPLGVVSFLDWFLVSCRLQAKLFKELQFAGLSFFFPMLLSF